MALLALDTSTKLASVALDTGARVLGRSELVTTVSERLLALVDDLFREAGLAPGALTAVACAAGPGSFTGLRIGLSTAKGLCVGTGAALVLVPTLEAMAATGPAGATVLAALDAFRGEVYAGLFTLDAARRPQAVAPELAAFAARPEELAARLGGVRPSHHVGDGFARHAHALPDGSSALPDGAVGDALVRLAHLRLAAGEQDDPRTASPRYVRASAPEEARRS